MKKALIVKDGESLEIKNCSDEQLFTLIDFLTIDVIDDDQYFLAWVDSKARVLGLDTGCITKVGAFIEVYPDYAEERELLVPKQEFIKILKEWASIVRKKPKEVVITKDGDKYSFDAEY